MDLIKSVPMKTLALLLIILQLASAFTNVYPKIKDYPLRPNEDAGNPLFLTPLLDEGKVDEARKRATVQHKEVDQVSSYAGYLTVNKQYDSNMFFWFFPAQVNPKEAPVALWLQGGPGASSMFGLFLEHGPFYVTQNKTLKMRKYSWNMAHNMLYIDNPVGAGFSFTKDKRGYVRNETEVGRDLLVALQQFFKLFPELQSNAFFLTGESYGGKYVPAIGHAIMLHNDKSELKINLQGLAIGNGLCDPINQGDYGAMLYQIGLLDTDGRKMFEKYETKAREFIKANKFDEAYEIFDLLLSSDLQNVPPLFKNLTGYDNYFNYYYPVDPNNAEYFSEWIQQADIRKAIHVGNNSFHAEDKTVMKMLKTDVMQTIAPWIVELLQRYRILFYNGQFDIIVAYVLTENFLKELKWPGADKYKNAQRHQWWVDKELAGYTKSAGKLTEAIVRNAGHMVPADQPKWALDLITRFTRGKPF